MKKRISFAIGIAFMVLIIFLYYNTSFKDKNFSNENIRQVNIEIIPKDDYITALDQYNINPMLNGFRKEISLPGDNAKHFYRITVKDEG